MEKCSLCGGKIVNHRCVDCGMPYPEKPRYIRTVWGVGYKIEA